MSKPNGADGTPEFTRVTNGYLEIRRKLGTGHPSSTGRSMVVASTGGFIPVEGSEVHVNLTVIKKNKH